MKATIYRSVAHMVMDETFIDRIASEMDKGTCDAVSSGHVVSHIAVLFNKEGVAV